MSLIISDDQIPTSIHTAPTAFSLTYLVCEVQAETAVLVVKLSLLLIAGTSPLTTRLREIFIPTSELHLRC